MKDNPIRKVVAQRCRTCAQFEALQRIGEHVDQDTRFDTFAEALWYIRDISASFGPHTDAQCN